MRAFVIAGLVMLAGAAAAGDGSDAQALPWFMTVRGGPEDRSGFESLLATCASASPSFVLIAADLSGSDRSPRPTIVLVRDDAAVSYGAFLRSGHKIDLGDLEALPSPPPDGMSGWQPSRCSILAHEVAEARYYHRYRDRLDALPRTPRDSAFWESHRDAIGAENSVRADLGQTECRLRDLAAPFGSEVAGVPHRDHVDDVVRYGGHTVRFHKTTPPRRELEMGTDWNNCDGEPDPKATVFLPD